MLVEQADKIEELTVFSDNIINLWKINVNNNILKKY